MRQTESIRKDFEQLTMKALDLGRRYKVFPKLNISKETENRLNRQAGLPSQSEKQLQNAILQYLSYQQDFTFFPFNNFGYFDRKKGIYRSASYTRKGVPDIVGWQHNTGKIIWIEVKSNTGKLSKEQREFKEHCVRHHTWHAVIRSLSEAEMFIAKIRHETS